MNHPPISLEQINQFFSGIQMNEKTHRYEVGGKQLRPSVTSLIKEFKPKVDWEQKKQDYAQKYGLTVEQVTQDWDAKKNAGLERGTKTHNFAENYIKDKTKKPETEQEEKVKMFLDKLPSDMLHIGSEIKIYHKEHLIPGTADMLFWTPKGYVIGDWKISKKMHDQFGGQRLLEPFSEFPNSTFWGYVLQLGFYQSFFEQIEGLKISNRFLVWIEPNVKMHLLPVPDISREIKIYLDSLKK